MKQQYRIIVREAGSEDRDEFWEDDLRQLVNTEVISVPSGMVVIDEIERHPAGGQLGVAIAHRRHPRG